MFDEFFISYDAAPITTCEKLASCLSTSLPELIQLADDPPYSEKTIPKKNGEFRELLVPQGRLKLIQERILRRIFQHFLFPRYLMGGIRDRDFTRDYIRCAALHCGAGILAKIDLTDFFPSITAAEVARVFGDLCKFPGDVVALLTSLCVYDDQLPQGASTSTALANAIMFIDEPHVAKKCGQEGVIYTRFVDDIIISHPKRHFPISKAENRVRKLIGKYPFEINEDKSVRQLRDTDPIEIMGLTINFSQPKLQAIELERIKKSITNLQFMAATPNGRKDPKYHKLWHVTSGRLNKLNRLNYPSYRRHRKKLSKINH